MTEYVRVNHANWRDCVGEDPEITLTTLAVAHEISRYGEYGTGTEVRPSMTTIAKRVGLANPKKVYPHLKKIKDRGYMRDTGRRHAKGVVVYELWAPLNIVIQAGATALGEPVKATKRQDASKPPAPVPRARKATPEPVLDRKLTAPSCPHGTKVLATTTKDGRPRQMWDCPEPQSDPGRCGPEWF